jgi:hypothetical protein
MSQSQVDATALLCRLLERDKPEINGQALVTDHADAATHLLRERLLVLGRTLDWVTCPECGIETARVVRELSPDRIALRCPDCAEAQAPRRLRETHKVALQRVIAATVHRVCGCCPPVKLKKLWWLSCAAFCARLKW